MLRIEPISLLDSSRSSRILEELLIGPLPLILNLLVQAQETAESESAKYRGQPFFPMISGMIRRAEIDRVIMEKIQMLGRPDFTAVCARNCTGRGAHLEIRTPRAILWVLKGSGFDGLPAYAKYRRLELNSVNCTQLSFLEESEEVAAAPRRIVVVTYTKSAGGFIFRAGLLSPAQDRWLACRKFNGAGAIPPIVAASAPEEVIFEKKRPQFKKGVALKRNSSC